MRNYFSFPNITSGFIAVLIGFTGSVALVIQAATTAGASQAEISSWFFALGFSIAITCIGLSLYCRMPILTGWSTPGAAILVTSLTGVSMPEAIGAFVFSAFLTILTGATGVFSAIMAHIPRALASAMLAGILLHFGMNVFVAMQDQMTLVCAMLITYLIGKRFFPRYVILLVLVVSVLMAGKENLLHLEHIHIAFATPIFTAPIFTLSTLISVGIPLFIVNTTSQNIPGLAAIHSSGYQPPISKIITWKGLAMLFFAPFGCYSIGLAALTAAICTSKEADADPTKRYKSTIFAGICWILVGIFGATVVALFFALPRELISALAGIALFSTIGSSLKIALEEETHREPAIITILVCASGISLFGIGSAFWGLIAGTISAFLLSWNKNRIVATVETPITR